MTRIWAFPYPEIVFADTIISALNIDLNEKEIIESEFIFYMEHI